MADEDGISHYQVIGLEHAMFDENTAQMSEAERLKWLRTHMDYRLKPIESTTDVPKDAIRIARMMGLNEEILLGAEEYMKNKIRRD